MPAISHLCFICLYITNYIFSLITHLTFRASVVFSISAYQQEGSWFESRWVLSGYSDFLQPSKNIHICLVNY